jgi:hypothetical protein
MVVPLVHRLGAEMSHCEPAQLTPGVAVFSQLLSNPNLSADKVGNLNIGILANFLQFVKYMAEVESSGWERCLIEFYVAPEDQLSAEVFERTMVLKKVCCHEQAVTFVEDIQGRSCGKDWPACI